MTITSLSQLESEALIIGYMLNLLMLLLYVRWPVRAIPLPICEFPKNDFSKQLLFQTATFPNSDFYKHELSVVYSIPYAVFLLMLAQGRPLTESPGVKPSTCLL